MFKLPYRKEANTTAACFQISLRYYTPTFVGTTRSHTLNKDKRPPLFLATNVKRGSTQSVSQLPPPKNKHAGNVLEIRLLTMDDVWTFVVL